MSRLDKTVSVETIIAWIKKRISSKKEKAAKLDFNAFRESLLKKPFTVKAGILGIIVAVFFVFLLLWLFDEAKYRMPIKVSGNIEGTEVRISFRVPGQIEELLTDEGMVIRVGEVVARLDTDVLSKIRREREASLEEAKYQHKLASDDHRRAENLFAAGSMPDQKREAAETNANATMANVEELRASLELANTRLGYADLASPLNGFVLVKSAEAGEVVHVGATVFTAIDLSDIWLTAYINERDLGRVWLNQKAYVKIDTYPHKKYHGWVSFISQEAEFTPKNIQTNEERVKYVYRIKVRVDNSSLELKPGMPGDGYIIME